MTQNGAKRTHNRRTRGPRGAILNTPHSVLKDFSFPGGSRYGHPDRNLQRKNTGNLHGEGFSKLQICKADFIFFPFQFGRILKPILLRNLFSHGTHGKQGKHGEHGKHGTHEASTWQARSFRLLDAGCWLLVADCWWLAAVCWLLSAGCWLLVAGCWLLAAGC